MGSWSAAVIPGDCHYVEGNYKMLRRFRLLRRLLKNMGIQPERIRLEWISAAEGEKVKRVVNELTDAVLKLGPLNLSQKAADLGQGTGCTGREYQSRRGRACGGLREPATRNKFVWQNPK